MTINRDNCKPKFEITTHFENKNETQQLTEVNDSGFTTSETIFTLV